MRSTECTSTYFRFSVDRAHCLDGGFLRDQMPFTWARLKRYVIWTVVIGLFIEVGTEAFNILFGSNFRIVISGRVYRCAQPSHYDLRRAAARYGIRTVINLRGYADGEPWYEEECRATAELDLNQEDICF